MNNQPLLEQTYSSLYVLNQKPEINPLALTTTKKLSLATLRSKKIPSKYKYGEMVVEWKCKYDKDTSSSICNAG
ncbi:4198_t:CDS:1, partial [Funneliformis geosporum]